MTIFQYIKNLNNPSEQALTVLGISIFNTITGKPFHMHDLIVRLSLMEYTFMRSFRGENKFICIPLFSKVFDYLFGKPETFEVRKRQGAKIYCAVTQQEYKIELYARKTAYAPFHMFPLSEHTVYKVYRMRDNESDYEPTFSVPGNVKPTDQEILDTYHVYTRKIINLKDRR